MVRLRSSTATTRDKPSYTDMEEEDAISDSDETSSKIIIPDQNQNRKVSPKNGKIVIITSPSKTPSTNSTSVQGRRFTVIPNGTSAKNQSTLLAVVSSSQRTAEPPEKVGPTIDVTSSDASPSSPTQVSSTTMESNSAINMPPGTLMQHPFPSRQIVIHPKNSAMMACNSSGVPTNTQNASHMNDGQITIIHSSRIAESEGSMTGMSSDCSDSENMAEVEAGRSDGQGSQFPIQYVSDGHVAYANNLAAAQHTMSLQNAYSPADSYGSHNSTFYQTNQGYQQSGQVAGGSIYVHGSGGNVRQLQQGHVIDDDSHYPPSHTTRASPATIQWLLANYETAEGVSLPRCTLYKHYLNHCDEQRLDPVNAASFGKLIRSVFLGLRTRRLGTRGNSKYHYYGIRIKPDSSLNQVDTSMPMAMRQQPMSSSRRNSTMGQSQARTPQNETVSTVTAIYSSGGTSGGPSQPVVVQQQAIAETSMTPQVGGNFTATSEQPVSMQQSTSHASTTIPQSTYQPAQQSHFPSLTDAQYQQYRGHLDLSKELSNYIPAPCLDDRMEAGVDASQLARFCENYGNHCEEVLVYVKQLNFVDVENSWRRFWCDVMNPVEVTNPATGLTNFELRGICATEMVQNYVKKKDMDLYHTLVAVLIPNVLENVPSPLTQLIRNFAKSLETCLSSILQGVPHEMVAVKLKAVSSFAHMLRRYTSLNHLAQAARGVMQNPQQISNMVSDLNRVNFKDIQDQAAFICQCDPNLVDSLERDFKQALQSNTKLEEWASWLQNVVTRVLRQYEGHVNQLKHAARQFLLKWSFYSSMIIRDLTLRSAASFGSFHLIRLLYDEYMFYLVEHKIAEASRQTALSVLAEPSSFDDPLGLPPVHLQDQQEHGQPSRQHHNEFIHSGNMLNGGPDHGLQFMVDSNYPAFFTPQDIQPTLVSPRNLGPQDTAVSNAQSCHTTDLTVMQCEKRTSADAINASSHSDQLMSMAPSTGSTTASESIMSPSDLMASESEQVEPRLVSAAPPSSGLDPLHDVENPSQHSLARELLGQLAAPASNGSDSPVSSGHRSQLETPPTASFDNDGDSGAKVPKQPNLTLKHSVLAEKEVESVPVKKQKQELLSENTIS